MIKISSVQVFRDICSLARIAYHQKRIDQANKCNLQTTDTCTMHELLLIVFYYNQFTRTTGQGMHYNTLIDFLEKWPRPANIASDPAKFVEHDISPPKQF
jgi:hypothetical protein